MTEMGADLREARRVIAAEADALQQLAENLGPTFVAAVDRILQVSGRVIVSGMGKSGHVARKIAATFASTGTPAQFVHPAEASHGDLGMLTKDDIALVLSNSGETPELADLVAHARRYGIALIAVATDPDSSLMQAADIAITLPATVEACPHGLTPTTSTTATLALGDALAVVIMGRREFTPQNFRMLHPGGKLGARLLQVRDLMHDGDAVPLVVGSAPMSEALVTMSAKGFGIVGVTDAVGALAGVISDGDLRRNMDGLLDRSASDVATAAPKVVMADALAAEALRVMNEQQVLCLFVTESATPAPVQPLGVIHIHDCLRAGIA